MSERAFNLLEEPWILALKLDGKHTQLSLLEVFRQAHQLHSLAGEMVAQDISLLRLLLGILYAVYGWPGPDGTDDLPHSPREARQRWATMWERGLFSMEKMELYLKTPEISERFYLFHPSTPFYQVAIDPKTTIKVDGKLLPLCPLTKNMRGLIGDIAEGENKSNLFSHRASTDTLSYPEAARWLVHFNSSDVSPLGAPPKDCFRAKGFKLPWPNTLGLVWASGSNLFETLMLNLVLAPAGHDPWQEFLPSWEGDFFQVNQLLDIEVPFPDDPCALFTYPFRRLQLRRDEQGQVNECVLWGGHLVQTEGGNPLTETMTLWRKDNQGRHMPKKHDPARQMWRDLGVLLPSAQTSPPGIVSWLSSLRNEGLLSLPMVCLNIGGVVLSSHKTSVDDAFSDSLKFNAALLAQLQESWIPRITRELDVTDKLVTQAGFLAGDLVRAAGGSGEKDPKAAAAKAREEVYFLLDIPFRLWLENLSPQDEIDQACLRWREQERNLLRSYGEQLVTRAGLNALTGRSVKVNQNDATRRTYASPDLYLKYLRKMNRILRD